MEKISEKIMVNKFVYYGQITSVLHDDQYGNKKNRSAIDAVMHLIHDIQNAFIENKAVTVAFLDIKNAFDYVFKNQLIKIMKKLNLPKTAILWTSNFMQNRKINLIFDNAKSQTYDVNIGTPQGSSISAILFSIYVKNMHDIINKNNVKSLNFIDDVIVYVVNKTTKQNYKELKQKIHKLFA